MYYLNIDNEDLKNINIEDINEYIKHIEKLTNIKWKIIPNYENYIISEHGNVIDIKNKKILLKYIHPKRKDNRVYLYNNQNKKIKFLLHRLVYNTFIDKKIKSKDKIYFKDGNKNNCHYSNLSLEFTLPKNLTDSKPILYNNTISTNIPKPIEYENLKKIIEKYKFNDITNFIENLQKDTKMEWRIIPNYEKYIISEHGNIISLKHRRILKYAIDKRGYYRVKLYKTYKNKLHKKMFRIYRLVYSAFIDKDIKELQIHHRDDNKLNNHYSNLIAMSISDHSKFHNNKDEDIKNYLKECEEIYNLKYEKNLTNEQLGKIFNVSGKNIAFKLSRFEVYLYLNRNFEKFKALSRKERNDLYTKIYKENNKSRHITIIKNRDKNISKYGKEIEKLKLAGLSDKDIMETMCMDKGEVNYYYRRYKDFEAIKEKYKVDLI